MMNRRRFLAISAAAAAAPASATPTRWTGYAMGAEVSLSFDASPGAATTAIMRVQDLLDRCETLFSLYRPESRLSRLNQTGLLVNPEPEFLQVMQACQKAHDVTGGRFDPTVQPLWSALAHGEDETSARQLVGWDRVSVSPDRIMLGTGQSLTLNGIAQGFATDLVAQELKQSGWSDVLINIGEFHAGGRYWTLGVSDPEFGLVETLRLKNRAIATSSPGVMELHGGQSHILNPIGTAGPIWSTISVQAADATTADALSTAFCYADSAEIAETLRRSDGTPTAICVHPTGLIQTITG